MSTFNCDTNVEKLSEGVAFLYANFRKKMSKQKEKLPNGKVIMIDMAKIRILCEILPLPFEPKVVLGKSIVHGKGVFVKEDVKIGTLLTLYPGDIVYYSPNGETIDKDVTMSPILSDRMIKKYGDNPLEQLDRLKNYKFGVSNNYSISGDPTFTDNPLYLGHFINDRFTCTSSKESQELYMKLSSARANCTIIVIGDNLHCAVIAIRDVKRGEELFTPYGINYWSAHNKE